MEEQKGVSVVLWFLTTFPTTPKARDELSVQSLD